jgi:hypothetical protein
VIFKVSHVGAAHAKRQSRPLYGQTGFAGSGFVWAEPPPDFP